jgi:hypothetical protein
VSGKPLVRLEIEEGKRRRRTGGENKNRVTRQ